MQANGSLRRPLWDVIKSIGRGGSGREGNSHGRAHEQSRGLRIPQIAVRRTESPARNARKNHPRSDGGHGVRSGAGIRRSANDVDRGPSGTNVFAQRTIARAYGKDGRVKLRHASTSFRKHAVGNSAAHASTTQSAPTSLKSHRWHGRRRLAEAGVYMSSKSTGEGEWASDKDRREVPPKTPTSLVRNILVKPGKEIEAEASADKFEAVIQDAIAGPVDYKQSRWSQLPAEGELRPRYFRAYQGSLQHRLMKQARRWQRSREKYGVDNARNWRSALDLLDRATPDGDTRHKRRIETVRLQEGLHATWNMNAGEVVLQIMQRTGAHLQTVPSVAGAGRFSSVSLWGTPAQNEHARKILTDYVEAADERQQPVYVYGLKSEADRDTTAADAIFGLDSKERTDTSYWREQDDIDDVEMELLEDTLGDITDTPNTHAIAPIRAVWAPSEIKLRARPERWNQLTFAAYIEALTSPVQRLTGRKIYGAQSPRSTSGHVENMIAELVRIFTMRDSGIHVSSHALDSTIQYFLKYNDFPAVRQVFLTLEDRGYEFTSSNFDSFCEAAAREESIPNFVYTLRLMISKGLRPTARTWTAFHLLMGRRFPLETNIVTEVMRRKGLFANVDTVKAVAAGAVDRELAAQLALRRSVEDFMISNEARYGEPATWMSARCVNKMARVLLERGHIDDATNLVRRLEAIARNKGRQGANASTLNTFLSSCMHGGNIDSAVAYVRLFMPSPPSHGDASAPQAPPIGRFTNDALAIKYDAVTFSILFSMAWHHRYFNLSRAVWRHACAAGMVSFKMQYTVRQSLRREVVWIEKSDQEAKLRKHDEKKSPPVTDRSLWATLAGKFVVGIGEGLPKVSQAYDTPELSATATGDQTSSQLDLILSERVDKDLLRPGYTNPGAAQLEAARNRDRLRQTRLSRKLLESDLAEVGSVEPVNPLLQDLERAWRLDLLWKEEGLGTVKRVKKEGRKGPKLNGEGEHQHVTLREAILDMFSEMLDRGVRVPMGVGDVAGVRDAQGLASVRYTPLHLQRSA